MNPYQQKIKKFCEERNWSQFHNPKDLLLGIVEEIGEFRNIIKWEQNPEIIKKVLSDNKEKVKDEIGDILWFLSILANVCEIDIDEAIKMTIEDNVKRFPIEKTKNKHTNTFLGGHDGKY
jgi:NTP pyrophosphatase (non-canonical NTP hydrolase)